SRRSRATAPRPRACWASASARSTARSSSTRSEKRRPAHRAVDSAAMRRAIAALLVLTAVARAGVIVVSGDAASVQAAIDAAASGDIVLIKPGGGGLDGELLVQGKSLTLVVDGGSYDVENLRLLDLPPGGQIVVRGLSLEALDGQLPFLGYEQGM